MKQQDRRSISGWKWAFFILLLINMGTILYVANLLNPMLSDSQERAVEDTTAQVENNKDSIQATFTMGNEDLQELLQFALTENNSSERIPQIKISDQVIVMGDLSVLGLEVAYQIEAEPFAVENGNLQLKVADVGLGNLSLPIRQVLQLFAGQLDSQVPIKVNPEEQIITILLSEIQTEAIQSIKLENIEKDVSEYTFIVTITKENLLQ